MEEYQTLNLALRGVGCKVYGGIQMDGMVLLSDFEHHAHH